MKTKTIEIFGAPTMSVPLWINNAWKGIVLEGAVLKEAIIEGGRKLSTIGMTVEVGLVDGYLVSYQEAMDKLKIHNPEAHEWWLFDNTSYNTKDGFIFNKGSCQVR